MTNFTNVVLNDCVCVFELLEKLLVSGGLDKNLFVRQSSIEALIQVVTISYLGITEARVLVLTMRGETRTDHSRKRNWQ